MTESSPCFGAVFYYFASPEEIRESLRRAMQTWQSLWPTRFTRMSTTGDTFRRFPRTSTVEEAISNLYDAHDFDRSLFFTFFDNPTPEALSQQLLFWGVTLQPEFKSRTPNYIYVQVPSSIPLEQCRNAFHATMKSCPFYLALGNFMVPCNPEGEPRSGSQACRELRNSELFLHEFDTTFRNGSYLDLLERQDSQFLAHPSQFIGLGKELFSKCEQTLLAADATDGFHVSRDSDSCILEIVSNEGLAKSANLLSSHFGPIEKPLMFWKHPEWDAWIQRMRSTSPGDLVEVAG